MAVIKWQKILSERGKFVEKRVFFALSALVLSMLCLCGCGNQTGWVEENGRTYYYLEDGTAASGWLEVDGSQYYFGSEGLLEGGFRDVDGVVYYFSGDGAKVSGWVDVDGRLYYLRQSGSLVTGWLSLDGQRYYLTETGAATGIVQIKDSIYLFDTQGRLTSGWVDLPEGRAYGDINGHPVTGWQTIEGQKYYFREDYLLQTGWAQIDGLTYRFREDGTPYQGITTDGEFASNGQLVILVNPWHRIPADYTVELTAISETHQIATVAYQDYLDMIRDCTNAGHQPAVCSAYRTQEYQQGLFDRKIQRLLEEPGNSYTQEEAQAVAARSVAVPGTSEHQLGLAVDIVDNRNWHLDESQAQMPTQKWLMENSWRYGWILRYPVDKSDITGIIYEPWHYRYVGKEVAAEIYRLGICLEEYLQMYTDGVG